MNKKIRTFLLCLGIFALLAASSLGIWFLTKKDSTSAGNVLGVAWYDENGTEFTIDTIEQLKELAALSEHYNFSGQTIKLGADIVDNEGTATEWEYEVPEHIWQPIQNFAGTFDGQGHTISGICGYGFVYGTNKTDIVMKPIGLFTNTQASCVIKDFRLVNSFFYSDFNEGVGSITSHGGGTFDSIYSDATILSYKQNTGGLIGMLSATGSHMVTNCWFDGEIRIEGNVGRYVGGIVGRIRDTKGQNKIEHCLNTGTLSSTLTGTGVNMGGLIGNIAPSGRAAIKDCLNVGNLNNEYAVAVGSVLGLIEKQASANIQDVYTTTDSYLNVIGVTQGLSMGFPMEYSKNNLIGYGGYEWTTLDFDNYWTVVEDDTPTLKYFAEKAVSVKGREKAFDVSWYDKNQAEYILSSKEDLFGFALLSRTTDFSGKIVKLGADIVLNEGDAKDWEKEEPQYNWVPIGTVGYPFAGVFDGDMHSISGVYLKTASAYAGFFSTTSEVATIKNFKLVNSYLQSDGASFGGIVGRGRGSFDTIYTNAIVVSSKTNLGGIIGQIPNDCSVLMTNCWFDGSVVHTGNSLADRRCGGLIGVMYANSIVNNCLNTGVIDASKYTTPNENNASIIVPLAGGLVGYVGKDKQLTISDCLNVGTVKVHSVATAGYGSVIGYVDGWVLVTDTYALDSSSKLHALRHSLGGEVATLDADTLKGYGAYQWTMLDFDKYWAVTKTDTPILKSFATEIQSIAGVKKMYDISWYNADKKSYVLDSMEDLHGFFLLSYNTNFEGKTIKLGADIVVNTGNATAWAQNAPKYKWSPVGSNSNPFKGTFDGQMHSISGIYLKTDVPYSGLFGATADEATIKNLRLTNSYFETSALSFGSIAGRARGTFDTIYSSAIVVSSTGNVAGIIGQVPAESKIKINNCWFDGSVTATGNTLNDRRIGGVVAVTYSSGSINNCLNTGTVNVSKYTVPMTGNTSVIAPLTGGIVGYVGNDIEVNMSDCLNVGKITVSNATTEGYGPIVGYRDGKISIVDTYATSDSCDKFNKSRINGLVTAIDSSMLKGYGAYQWTFLDFEKYWAVVMDSTPILQSFAGVVPSLAGIDKMIDYSWMEQAKGTAEDPYILKDAADLYGFAKLSQDNDFAGKTIVLRDDIVVNKDMNSPTYAWTPIGTSGKPFAGTFDGYNPETKEIHSISGIYLKTNERFAGLFASTSGSAVLKNFSLEDSYIETTAGDCGSIVGRGSGTLDTVKSSATVISSNGRVSGLVGQAMGENIVLNNCWFAGKVTATGNSKDTRITGGLIGLVNVTNATVKNCLNTGIVDVTAYTTPNSATSTLVVPLAGGLVGQVYEDMKLTISDCLNTGEVQCSAAALENEGGYGSIIGYSEGETKITDTYATTESCKIVSGGKPKCVSGKTNQVSADSIKGYDGYQWTVLNFDKYWTVVLDDEKTAEDETGTPILQSFADVVPNLADIEQMIDFSWMEQAKGTEADPYILKDAADLYGLATLSAENSFENKFFRLGADIVVNKGNASEWKEEAPSYNWTPIGSHELPFAGVFDGSDPKTGVIHSVSGIYLNTTSRWSGLFGETTSSAKIQNLKLKNTYMRTSAADFGSIVGVGNGEFTSIYSEAIIDCAAGRTGGMFGQANGTDVKITNCWFAGTLTSSSKNGQGTGGLVGVVVNDSKLTMLSCFNTGTVDVTAGVDNQPYAGGLIGQVGQGKFAELVLGDSFNAGKVSVNTTKHSTGFGSGVGMVSNKAKSTITNTYCTPESCSRQFSITTGCTYTGYPLKPSGSVLGSNAQTTMPLLSWETTWESVPSMIPVLKVFKDEVIDTSWYEEATGAEEDPYILYDKADLYGFASLSAENHFKDKFFRLGADIVVNKGNASNWKTVAPNYHWTPIGSHSLPFAGVFDGSDPKTGVIHSISGIYLNTTSRWSGLFAETASTAKIKNLKLKNSYMTTSAADFGSIVGVGNGEFSAIYSEALIDCAAGRTGGLFGQASGADVKITNCWFAGTLTCSSKNAQEIGGLVGVVVNGSKLTMKSCLNTGTVDVSACVDKEPYAGGLVGRVGQGNFSELVLDDSFNEGTVDVNTKHSTGFGSGVGMVSNRAKSTITNTYCTPESCRRQFSVTVADPDKNIQGATYSGYPLKTNGSVLGSDAQDTMPLLTWGIAWSTVTEPQAGLPVLTPFIGIKE